MITREASATIYKTLCRCIPGGVNSPVRSFKGLDMMPLIAERSEGDLVFDRDGNSWIDYIGSWGPLIMGAQPKSVVAAAKEAMDQGCTFGLTTAKEADLAEKIVSLIPSIEKVRFVSSGTEACMTAIRVARSFTGKDKIVKFAGCYHGHADPFLVQAGSSLFSLNQSSSSSGVPKQAVANTLVLPFNDIEQLERLFASSLKDDIACVIVEPVAGNMGVVPPCEGFLEALREQTEANKSVLIFDEVMTGFRLALRGAQSIFGIEPDLSCFAKVIGGGFPAACVGGKAAIMDHLAPIGSCYQAGTLSGNPVAMAAGLATLSLLEEEGIYDRLEEKACRITKDVKQVIKDRQINACIQQVGCMFSLFFGKREVRNADDVKEVDKEIFASFFRYLFERGVLIPPSFCESWFVSLAHTDEHLDKTKQLIIEYITNHL